MQVPDRLYHATRPANVGSIRATGLRASWGEQYLCESPEDCLVFVGSRIRHAITSNTIPVVVDGVTLGVVPEIEVNDTAAVIVVDGTLLDPGRIEASDDHLAFFFGDTPSWRYTADIGPEAILDVLSFDLTGADRA